MIGKRMKVVADAMRSKGFTFKDATLVDYTARGIVSLRWLHEQTGIAAEALNDAMAEARMTLERA